MKKSILIVGLGRFGLNLIEFFSRLDVDIIGIDVDEDAVNKAVKKTPYVYTCDSTNEEALKEIGISNIDIAIIALGQDNPNGVVTGIMTTILLKRLGVAKIVVRLDDEIYRDTFLAIGATETIQPIKIASERIANRFAMDNIVDYFNIIGDFNVFEMKIPETFKPISLVDLNSRSKYGINIILISREDQTFTPNSTHTLRPNDDIFIFGKKSDVIKFETFVRNNTKKS
ncbi:MAG: TrkA family potassium uptake protein [Bacilli bacterium]|jgi:trk system potassium uptake protein TrkA|nr:TrkA family potassium uptake protein [Bacilli bacterium]